MTNIELIPNNLFDRAISLLINGGQTGSLEEMQEIAKLLSEGGGDDIRIFRKNEIGIECDMPTEDFIGWILEYEQDIRPKKRNHV